MYVSDYPTSCVKAFSLMRHTSKFPAKIGNLKLVSTIFHYCFFFFFNVFLRYFQRYTLKRNLTYSFIKIDSRLTYHALPAFLKELRNRILRIICLRSSFCSIRVYTSLQFLPILLRNYFFCVSFGSLSIHYFELWSHLYKTS